MEIAFTTPAESRIADQLGLAVCTDVLVYRGAIACKEMRQPGPIRTSRARIFAKLTPCCSSSRSFEWISAFWFRHYGHKDVSMLKQIEKGSRRYLRRLSLLLT